MRMLLKKDDQAYDFEFKAIGKCSLCLKDTR